ncbi:hypothetical protein J0S82_015865 [Galemys pyrenaicus]|uniref:Uncharacterized protein n=1 Tax=Galemys pyrenaicus TaxID=202257 RepID=A0A8J5ZNB4_GALPY|nr:hypothetical protein J0S82_015865 [Galemys pyrenaicus]
MDPSLRNVLVLSFGFLLLFTAYGALQNLQVSPPAWNGRPEPGVTPRARAWGDPAGPFLG